MTEILEGPEAIVAAVARLGLGEPIAFPTETVYGLGADALDADAVERIFKLKGRPANNPLIVHVSGWEMAEELVKEWTDDAQKLAKAFWPGSLTLVLEKSERVPDIVTAGGSTVAIRCPAHPIALGLIESLGKPIVGPSANPSGFISPTTADHVARGFDGQDVLILDGGACRAGIESTVVDLTSDEPSILRAGVVSHAQIGKVLGRKVVIRNVAGDRSGEGAARSPGLLGAHYQPSKPTRLCATSEINLADQSVYLIAWSVKSAETVDSLGGFSHLPPDAAGYARGLYNAMHDGDASETSEIWIESPPESDDTHLWHAIMERLNRACPPK
jgi:L-threonylcarbamoyladenylate synthase